MGGVWGAECTSATRTRTRTCPDALPTKPCPGQPSEDENCLSVCPLASWSVWVPGPCMGPDISCSPGTRTETRTCRSRGNVVDDVFCAGGTPASTRQTNCQEDLCASYSAFTFTLCTNVCRTGTRSGVRSCITSGTVPAGCLTKQESCFDETACVPSWSGWSQWGACGEVECTSATRTRTRTCPDALPTKPCPGQPSEDENCLSVCPLAAWSVWVPGQCMGPDISCSPGTRTETRTCRSRGNVVDDVFCAGGTPASTRQTNCQEVQAHLVHQCVQDGHQEWCQELYRIRDCPCWMFNKITILLR